MKTIVHSALFGVAIVAVSVSALAQAPVPLKGKLKSIRADGAVVTTEQGDVSFTFAPDWFAMVVAKADLASIKEGSFIGTTNVDDGPGGRSVEVHVFPPGTKLGEGQRVMDAETGTKMTNGTVGKVVTSPNGPQFDVAFPGDVRHVTVPKDALITTMTPVDRSYLKAGMSVNVNAAKGPDGQLMARGVTTGPNGTPPAR